MLPSYPHTIRRRQTAEILCNFCFQLIMLKSEESCFFVKRNHRRYKPNLRERQKVLCCLMVQLITTASHAGLPLLHLFNENRYREKCPIKLPVRKRRERKKKEYKLQSPSLTHAQPRQTDTTNTRYPCRLTHDFTNMCFQPLAAISLSTKPAVFHLQYYNAASHLLRVIQKCCASHYGN